MFCNLSKSRAALVPRHRVRPRLDILEDRSLLSTLTVTSPADSGPGTLRDRVAAAVSGDTIKFAPSLVGQTITLTSGPVVDTGKSLTIAGPGASKLTVSGNDSSTVLVFVTGGDPSTPPSIDVTVSGLTLAHGNNAYSGGAMFTYGANVTLKDAVIRDSHSDSAGGGFDAAAPFTPSGVPANTVTIVNSQFLNNSAGQIGGAYEGFGLTMTISGSLFQGNSSPGLAGGVVVGGASLTVSRSAFLNNNGGGLTHFAGFAPGTQQLTVSASTFTGNVKSNGFGGAIESDNGPATITDSTFTNNATTSPSFTQGGAVSITGGDAIIDRSTFIGNRADNVNSYEARGGAVFIEGSGYIARVTNSTFRDNVARGPSASAGAVERSFFPGYSLGSPTPETTFTGDTFLNNSAISTTSVAVGGAVEISGAAGPTLVSNSTFVGNSAIGGDSTTSLGNVARGGALVVQGDYSPFATTTLTITGSTFVDNAARGGRGTSGGIAEGGAVLVGGGFSSQAISGGSFVGNQAVAGIGGHVGETATGLAFGGAIRNFYGVPLTISGTTFVANSAVASDGGDSSLATGGAISGPVGGVSAARFVGNTAHGGRGGDAVGTGDGGRGGDAYGGAIDSLSGTVTNSLFAGNLAIAGDGGKGAGTGSGGRGGDAEGGAAAVYRATVSSSQFLGNAAFGGHGGRGGTSGVGGAGGDAKGGAIAIDVGTYGGTLDVSDSLFTLNLALGGSGGSGVTTGATGQGLGGAIYNSGGTVTVKRTRFLLNHATTAGNDIYGPYTT